MASTLVTGGAGFIGSHVVDTLAEEGHDVAIVDNLSTGKRDNLRPGVAFHDVDIRDRAALSQVLDTVRPEFVFHLAAQIDVRRSTREPVFDAECNVIGSINLLEACVSAGVRKVIYTNTGGALYGEVDPADLPLAEEYAIAPVSQYAISKHTVEHYLYLYSHLYGLAYTSLRLPNIYGPRQDPHGEAGVVAIFMGRMLAGEAITIFGDGSQTRDYLYVRDVARAALAAMSAGDGEAYNLGTGVETSVLELASAVARVMGYEKNPEFAPERPGELSRNSLDAAKARRELAWEPGLSFQEGLEATLAHSPPSSP